MCAGFSPLDPSYLADTTPVGGVRLDPRVRCGEYLEIGLHAAFGFPFDDGEILSDGVVHDGPLHGNHDCGTCRKTVARSYVLKSVDSLQAVEDLVSGAVREECAKLTELSRCHIQNIWSPILVGFDVIYRVDNIGCGVSCGSPVRTCFGIDIRSIRVTKQTVGRSNACATLNSTAAVAVE